MENEQDKMMNCDLFLCNVKLFIKILWKMSCHKCTDFEIQIHWLISSL